MLMKQEITLFRGGQTNLQLQVPLFLSQYSIENRQSMERLEQQFQLIIDEQIE